MKKGCWAAVLAFLLAAGCLGSLPRGREMEELQLVTALALDGRRVTAVTGVRASEGEEPQILTGEGDSLAAACGELRAGSARRAYLGQAEKLLVGEGQDLLEAMDFVLSDRELRLDTLLYIVKGEAGAAMARTAKEAAGAEGRDPRSRTVGELLPRLAEGDYVMAPALREDDEGKLIPSGWAVIGPGGVVGYLEDAAADGAQLLAGQGEERVVTLSGGAVELTGVRRWAVDGRVACILTGRVVQGTPTAEELAAWGEKSLRAALEPGWDCWGLDRELGALAPWRWATVRGTDVSALKVKVTGKLVGNGEDGG